MKSDEYIARFDKDGFVQVDGLIGGAEINWYLGIYDKLLTGEIQAGHLRSDLGAGVGTGRKGAENITQIMWPSALVPSLRESAAYDRALQMARHLLGADVDFDFDMLINKAPGTSTPTPWHQDCAYWPDLPDRRAASCWIALDEATMDNGCMWFVPASHRGPLRKHQPVAPGRHALVCEASESEGVCVPLKPGSCTFHAGATLHYSRGNSTPGPRRALILNFRPAAMIELERAKGFDHGRTQNFRVDKNAQVQR